MRLFTVIVCSGNVSPRAKGFDIFTEIEQIENKSNLESIAAFGKGLNSNVSGETLGTLAQGSALI
jgi:hypothetical protein